MKLKEVVIVGEEEIGKTTIANALLGWDIFPQSNDGQYFPTKENTSQLLTKHIQLTDTPGYDLLWYQVPEAVTEAVSRADTIIMVFAGFYDERDFDLNESEPETLDEIHRFLANQAKEECLQKELLERANTRDIYFVLPYYSEDGPVDRTELERNLCRAKERFASYSDHGDKSFYCVDPMMGLIAAIEDDQSALKESGILSLRAAVTGSEE